MRTDREPGEILGPRMSLFADVLSVGVAVAVVSLPLVTLPAALSTACEVLRGVRDGRPVTARRFLGGLRRRLRSGDVAAGLVTLAGLGLLLVDLALVSAGLPGGSALGLAVAAVGVCAAVVGLRACARTESAVDWPGAVRGAAHDAVRDPGGSALVVLAVLTAALCAWMLLPLAFLVPGLLALALTAIDVRGATKGTGVTGGRGKEVASQEGV
ncbi:hypothetical protein [Streptomyces neyagawaensis]|uniref:hypothetical protein n=1 Tax=Streptomyces neyagawaensis TaxID=42238 RepID=UPI0006E1F4BA|nr:hypothetical protein [Streptomyces neyagawaensis]MCL6731011.1 hypothetical protein [Streptomyces neyagawaensis]MDE1686267.1 hypothetical protein [Streptomyces neyagawaensis]